MKIDTQAAALRHVVRRFRAQPLSYSLGRFALVRRAYGTGRGIRDRLGHSHAIASGRALFTDVDIQEAAASLHRGSFFVLPTLPNDVVSDVVRFATDHECRRQTRPPMFYAADVRDGRLPGGEIAILADVVGAERCEAVRSIENEPSIRAAVSQYLGYVPKSRRIRLIWSFVASADDNVRMREGQTVGYHFDVQSYNFVYANFYLTNVDARSGAHTMIVGSHVDKPIRWLFGPATRSDAEIRGHYPVQREITLTGGAGFGFLQDASCYHRALAPIDRPRLMLQIRYF